MPQELRPETSRYIQHSHGTTDAMAYYEVRQTISHNLVLDTHAIVARVQATLDGKWWRYGTAMDIADAIRKVPGAYAVVDTVYADGCTSRDGYQTPIEVEDLTDGVVL